MTGDGRLRTLAAHFCGTLVCGSSQRVNNAIEILHRLLKAVHEAPHSELDVEGVNIEWNARDGGQGLPTLVGPDDVPGERLLAPADFETTCRILDGGRSMGGVHSLEQLARYEGGWVKIAIWKLDDGLKPVPPPSAVYLEATCHRCLMLIFSELYRPAVADHWREITAHYQRAITDHEKHCPKP